MKNCSASFLALVLATGLFAACSGSGSARRRREARPPAAARPPRRTGKRQTCCFWLPPVRGGRRRRAGQGVLDGNAGALGRGKQRGPHHRDHALGQLRGKNT